MERALIWCASGLALAIPVASVIVGSQEACHPAHGAPDLRMGLGVALIVSAVALACVRERSARDLGGMALVSVGIALFSLLKARIFPGIAWIIAPVDVFVLIQAIRGPRQTIPFAVLGNAVILFSASVGDAQDTFFCAILLSAALVSSFAVWASDERHRAAMLAVALSVLALAVGGLAQ
jgi:hypothetical protein